MSRVPGQYWDRIDEFMGFISELVARVNAESGVVRVRHARTLNVLLRDFDGGVGDRAKLNAFLAFLIFRGYATRGELVRSGLAVSDAIYTWLKYYRELLGLVQPID